MYVPNNWKNGDVITADKLNNTENGVQGVQTQVNNSAVGTNLLLKTGTPFSMTGNNTAPQFQKMYSLNRRLEKRTVLTISFDAVSTASANFMIQSIGSADGGTWMSLITDSVDTTKKHYAATITLDGLTYMGVRMLINNIPSTTTITISNMKLELGSQATDWCPNPADVLTQSDYTKIKAAIVALGGSLS